MNPKVRASTYGRAGAATAPLHGHVHVFLPAYVEITLVLVGLRAQIERNRTNVRVTREICQRRSFLRREISRLSHDVQRPVQIGVDEYAVFRLVKPTLLPIPAEFVGRFRLAFLRFTVGRDRVIVEEARLGRVAFLLRHHPDPRFLTLVTEDFDEREERDLNEVLVVLLPDANLVLPPFRVANDEFCHTFAEEERDELVCDSTEQIANLLVPLSHEVTDFTRRVRSFWKFRLQLSLLLVEKAVERLNLHS